MKENQATTDEVIMSVHPAQGRRILGVASLWVLSVMLTYFAVIGEGWIGARGVLLLAGFGLGWAAILVWRASATVLDLTERELREHHSGRLIARISDITSIERGFRIMKPSNGVLITTLEPQEAAFVPGTWWRRGKLIAIGGMTKASQVKALAEIAMQMSSQQK